MSQQSPSLASIGNRITTFIKRLRPYAWLIFLVFTLSLYGFVLFRINTLSNATPSDSDVSDQIKATKTPRVDQSVIDKLQQLQDNSVNVKTLFNDTRSNPFQ